MKDQNIFDESLLLSRNSEIHDMKDADIYELALEIDKAAFAANRNTKAAESATSFAVLDAWTCGAMLQIAKQQLEPPEFNQWVEDVFGNLGMSMETAMKHMHLAERFPDAKNLLNVKHDGLL
jgi:hypothetical protein